MPTHVKIGGHPTWVDDRAGPGEALLLLHGGLGHSDDLLNSAAARRIRVLGATAPNPTATWVPAATNCSPGR